MAKNRGSNQGESRRIDRTPGHTDRRSQYANQAIEVPTFGAICQIIGGQEVITEAQRVLASALGTRAFTPVETHAAIILSPREFFESVQWGTAGARRARYDSLVSNVEQDMSRIPDEVSPGLQFGQLHVIRNPSADPRHGSRGANKRFIAAQLYPGSKEQSPALRMRTVARAILTAANQGHPLPSSVDIMQPFIPLGEYLDTSTGIDTRTNKILQQDLRALGTLTVGPLVITEGFDPRALAPIPA